jgi:hypothetical protein
VNFDLAMHVLGSGKAMMESLTLPVSCWRVGSIALAIRRLSGERLEFRLREVKSATLASGAEFEKR